MKTWLIVGTLAGMATGAWLAHNSVGLDIIDGLAIGCLTGLISAFGFASIPWRSMGRREL